MSKHKRTQKPLCNQGYTKGMSVLVVRHGLSQANNRENIGTLAFAAEQAPLMHQGHEQARAMGQLIIAHYGITPSTTDVATSTLLRTQQTATSAGFLHVTPYTALDEIHHHLPLNDLRAMLDAGKLPAVAITEAEETLTHPPAEAVWITHGLRIAALCAVLGVHQQTRLIPRFCEVRELPIDT